VAVGLTALSEGNDYDLICRAYAANAKPNGAGFTVRLDSWLSSTIPYAEAGWFGVGGADANDYQIGRWFNNLYGSGRIPMQNQQRVWFPTPFAQTPKIAVFVNAIAQWNGDNFRFETVADGADPYGFNLHMNAWAGTQMIGAGATWIAYPADKKLVANGQDSSWNYRPWQNPAVFNGRYVAFPPGTFQSPPQVYIALQSFDVDRVPGFRLRASVTGITAAGFTWHCDGFIDGLNPMSPVIYGAGISWLAFA